MPPRRAPREAARARKAREEREAEAALVAEQEAEAQRIAAEAKAEEDRATAAAAEKAEADSVASAKEAEAARFSKAEEKRLNDLLAECEKEMEDEEAEEACMEEKERLDRALRILQHNTEPGYITAKEALRHDLGENTFKHLAEECFGIPTFTFDYKTTKRPATNPELTIWAYMDAWKKCSYKGLEHVSFGSDELPEEPNTLFLHKKKGKNTGAEYMLNFSPQNADAMLCHLYGAKMP
ncbi:hypothetical protein ACKLNR_009512 [Fusarium oxysporum f. sp. zingiberi]